MKRHASLPLLATIQDVAGVRHVQIEDRGAALVLRALVDANGAWVGPQDIALTGASLSRHAALLRRHYGIQVQSETVQDGMRFFNRHRLGKSVAIEIAARAKGA